MSGYNVFCQGYINEIFTLKWYGKNSKKKKGEGNEIIEEYVVVSLNSKSFINRVVYINYSDMQCGAQQSKETKELIADSQKNSIEVVRRRDLKDFITYLESDGYHRDTDNN